MKFPRLEIANFLAITSADINLADRGLVLIQGINNADTSAVSNGAGKSSIADALCWALYGTTARDVTGDDVVNTTAGKGCRVAVTVQEGGMTYTIARHRKHKTGKNSLTVIQSDGLRETDLTKGTDKLTQEVVQQIIGASLDVFAGSIYAGQERMPDLPAMTDKALKMLIEEASGVVALEDAYKRAREEQLAVQSVFKDADLHRTLIRNDVDRRYQTLEEIDTSETNWKLRRDADIAAIRDNLQTNLLPGAKDLTAKIAAQDRMKLEARIAAADARIAAVVTEQVTLNELRTKFVMAEGDERNVREIGLRELGRLSRARTDLDSITHKIGCPCTECGRPLTTAELDSVTKAAQKQVDDLILSSGAVATEHTAAGEAAKSAREAFHAFQATMTDLTEEVALRDAATASLSELVLLTSKRDAVIATAKREGERMKALIAEVSPFDPQREGVHVSIRKLEVAEADAIKKVEREQRKADVAAEVVKVFSPAGVRSRVLDEITPYLNAQTSKYLSILSDGNLDATWTTLTTTAKGELRENFSIDVKNVIGGQVFKGISGGEKRKVRIASSLALQDLVATRATKPIDLFIGDEIDDALDPAGLERLMIILEEKASERGSVFVISHNEIRDQIRNVLTVEKSATGETTITESVV